MPAPIARTVVKVQVTLATSDRADLATCLVYDKHKKHVVQQPISQNVRDALKGEPRAFFEATFDGGAWQIHRRVPEQFW